jgi:NAD-dependent deacetylase
VASVQALAANPLGVWEFLLDALRLFHRAEPNPAHRALAALEADGLLAGVVTQNIDGLHQRAGSRRVVEFHGSVGAWHCQRCGRSHDHARYHELAAADLPVTCPCGGLVRPGVVFFGRRGPGQRHPLAREARWGGGGGGQPRAHGLREAGRHPPGRPRRKGAAPAL